MGTRCIVIVVLYIMVIVNQTECYLYEKISIILSRHSFCVPPLHFFSSTLSYLSDLFFHSLFPSPSLFVVVVLGHATGKTALIRRFVSNEFPREYCPTIDDVFETSLEVDSKVIKVQILDTGLCVLIHYAKYISSSPSSRPCYLQKSLETCISVSCIPCRSTIRTLETIL